MRPRTLGFALAVASLLALGRAEDASPAPQMPALRARTELVLLPTLVHDKSGAPVRGLGKSDFTLLENGAERKIAVFEEVQTTAVRPRRPSLPAGVFSNYLVRESAPRRVTIIVMDSINTRFNDKSYARDQILKFLGETAASNEPIALLQLQRGGVRVIHDFTTDPAVLAKALRRFTEGAAPQAGSEQEIVDPDVAAETGQFGDMMREAELNFVAFERLFAARLTLDGMQAIARAYAAIPGRKSLIWASGGFPFSIDDLTRALSGGVGAATSSLFDILPYYEKTWQALNDANMALYPVDVRGLVVLGADVSRRSSGSGLQSAYRREAWMHHETLATFAEFADMTGGKAYYNTNDLVHAFRAAVDDSASYYMLGFYLAPDDRKPGWRKLQVKVKQAHVQVRTRSGFYVLPAEKDKEKSRQSDVQLAMTSPLDFTSLPLLVRWTTTTPQGEMKRAVFEIILPANAAVVDESDQNYMSMDFEAAAREPTGKIVASHGRTLEAHLKPESLSQVRSKGITYTGDLDLPPGEYTVRFVVRDNLSGRMGSVGAPLTIP